MLETVKIMPIKWVTINIIFENKWYTVCMTF